jgi:hypothetical protein
MRCWVMRWYLVANVPLVVAVFALPLYHLEPWGLLGLSAAAAVFVGTVKNGLDQSFVPSMDDLVDRQCRGHALHR